jgi:hypothetical protein
MPLIGCNFKFNTFLFGYFIDMEVDGNLWSFYILSLFNSIINFRYDREYILLRSWLPTLYLNNILSVIVGTQWFQVSFLCINSFSSIIFNLIYGCFWTLVKQCLWYSFHYKHS